MPNLKIIQVRVPEAVYDALRRMSAREQRSISAEVRLTLHKHTHEERHASPKDANHR